MFVVELRTVEGHPLAEGVYVVREEFDYEEEALVYASEMPESKIPEMIVEVYEIDEDAEGDF